MGQPIFAVVAMTRDAARRAVLRARIEIVAEKPNVTVEQALAAKEEVLPDYAFVGGDAEVAIPRRPPGAAAGTFGLAGRSIFISRAKSPSRCPAKTTPCWSTSSTQHPSEVQHITAQSARRAGFDP